MDIITNNRSETRALTWQERRAACRIADFLRRRRGYGHSETAILAQAKRIWPDLAPNVLAAAQFLVEVRDEGWPET